MHTTQAGGSLDEETRAKSRARGRREGWHHRQWSGIASTCVNGALDENGSLQSPATLRRPINITQLVHRVELHSANASRAAVCHCAESLPTSGSDVSSYGNEERFISFAPRSSDFFDSWVWAKSLISRTSVSHISEAVWEMRPLLYSAAKHFLPQE